MEFFTVFAGIASKLQKLDLRFLGNTTQRRDDLLDSMKNQQIRLSKFFALRKNILLTLLDKPD